VTTAYVTTRQSLHAVAEHVMATASYAALGKIGLRPSSGGFATQELHGKRMIVRDGSLNGVPIHGKTLAELGARDVALPYTPVTTMHDDPLAVDAPSATSLGNWYGLVAVALGAVMPPDAAPQQIWPEHFDLATSSGEANYGGSPGDETYPEPYLYVGPWDRSDASTFDDPWGWTYHARDITGVEDAMAFFRQHL
jgi:hypothetical protein